MSDTITLVAGILLTSVGLLALLPFVLRLAHRPRAAGSVQVIERALAAATPEPVTPPAIEVLSARHPEEPVADAESVDEVETSSVQGDMEELMAHLFSLRMTVSDITGEVQEVHDALVRASDEVDAQPEEAEPDPAVESVA